ncbi:fibrinogen- and Ig-binding protein-like [Palaemon carinicauda]|uniref:fibrinogen- and Ig-binding protein-like n=1 Tax=Palaemon carinicauda TaxID=392227 RepID=UPI0035B67C5B
MNFERSFRPRHLFSLEKAEDRNDQICDELFAKAYIEKELENARQEIRILEKRLERVAGDLETANEKLLEKSDLEEYVESADNEIRTLWAELDSVKAENKRLKTENVGQSAALESELNAAVEEVYRIGTKLDTVLDEKSKLKTELLIKKDVVCDLEMAEEELEKLWKEVAGVKAENRQLKRDLSEERTTRNALMKADEKNKILEEEIRNLTSVADEFAINKEKYQAMIERNMNLEMELNNKNYAITQLCKLESVVKGWIMGGYPTTKGAGRRALPPSSQIDLTFVSNIIVDRCTDNSLEFKLNNFNRFFQ